MLNHTPGPWHCFDLDNAPQVGITDETGTRVLATIDITDSQDEANTTLIAASPDLFELGRWISRCASMKGPAGTTAYLIKPEKMEELRALIARIEGGE